MTGGYIRREYPQWSWSFSRNQIFQFCQRRYYYNYYGSHNGWERNAPAEVALAYRLKKLTSIYLVLGDAVHKVAEDIVQRVIKGESVPSADFVEEEIRRHLRRVWRSSRDEQEYFHIRPSRVDMLHEFYYGMGVSDETIERVNRRTVQVAKTLVQSQVWSELALPGTELISCEQFDTFSLNDTPVYAVPDVLYKTSSDQWIIVDWKTGEEVEDNREQVALYALYVQEKHSVPVENITARLEYLSLETVEEMSFDAQDLQAVQESALASMAMMRELLADSEQNIPLAKDAFSLTDTKSQCYWCNFYELCREELGEVVS